MPNLLRTLCVATLALALLPSAALAQEPGGDAPDGTTAAQDADGLTTIAGDIEVDGDVDCFAIYIDDPAAFSATTDTPGSDPTFDSNLYLFEGTVTGATDGVAFNDDCPGGCDNGGLLSTITAGSLPGPNGAGVGKYVLCVTEFDVDPLNAAGEDIFPGTPFSAVLYPNNLTDIALASWNPTSIGFDTVNYEVALTGVGTNPGTGGGSCEDDVVATFIPDMTTVPSAGGTVTFDVTIENTGNASCFTDCLVIVKRPRNREVFRDTLESGLLSPGEVLIDTYELEFPSNGTDGVYKVIFLAGDLDDQVIFDRVRVDITKGGSAVAGSASAVAAATKVSPNPFTDEARITFATDASADVRLAVYDVLGREVAVLVDGMVDAGTHVATFEARDLAAGTYVYRLSLGDEVQTGRITLAR